MRFIITETQYFKLLKEDGDASISGDIDVEKLQSELVDKGYNIGTYGKNKDGVDGKYGPLTKAAHEAMKKGTSADEFNKKEKDLSNLKVDDANLVKTFNFHKVPVGNNNYRSGQITGDILPSVIKKYGIKNIIRLNGDGADAQKNSRLSALSVADEKEICEQNGCKFHQISSHQGYNKKGGGYVKSLEQVSRIMDQGNTLIHCRHGADRTGGMVGGYLKNKGWGTEDEIWDYTTKYNSWLQMGRQTFYRGYNKYAESFISPEKLRTKK